MVAATELGGICVAGVPLERGESALDSDLIRLCVFENLELEAELAGCGGCGCICDC